MAPCNGTQQWHHVHSTIAHYNGTLQWHPAMAPRPLHPAMAFWCHVQCAKVVRRPPPLLEVRTPIAIAIRGKNTTLNSTPISFWLQLRESTSRGVKKTALPNLNSARRVDQRRREFRWQPHVGPDGPPSVARPVAFSAAPGDDLKFQLRKHLFHSMKSWLFNSDP